MNFTAAIKVPSDQLQFLQSVVEAPNADLGRDDIVWEGYSDFTPKGEWALFQVISSGNPAVESCWSQCVLFDARGNEITCSEVSETLLGAFEFDVDGTRYTVNVAAE